MITLFHSPSSRSSRFVWLLEELEAPYKIRNVSIRRSDGSGALDPVNPHPHGKVPAIEDDGVLVFESAAIALYLTDGYPKNEIGPQVGDRKRGPYVTWLAYYAGVTEPAVVSKFLNFTPPRGAAGWVAMEETMDYVNKTLEKGPYLLGERFSAADVLFASSFALFIGSPLLPKTSLLEHYLHRCTERPAYGRATSKSP